MNTRFFGKYLLGKDLISKKELARATNIVFDKNIRLGEYALKEGLLTEEQLAKIIEIQRKEEALFGEVAEKLGFLTIEQVDYLLKTQNREHMLIGEALMVIGALEKQTLERELEQFKKEEESYSNIKFKALPDIVSFPELVELVLSTTFKYFERLLFLPLKFDSWEIFPTGFQVPSSHHGAVYEFSNSFSGRFMLSLPNDIFSFTRSIKERLLLKVGKKLPLQFNQDLMEELINNIGGYIQNNMVLSTRRTPTKEEYKYFPDGDITFPIPPDMKSIAFNLDSPEGQVKVLLLFEEVQKILVIDDNHLIRETYSHILSLQNYNVFTAENGQEGLEIFEAQKPNIVILDIMMPKMNGIEVLEKLKEMTYETEVIIITGHAGLDSAIKAVKLGAFDYLQKPVEGQFFLNTIRKALEKRDLFSKLKQYVLNLENSIRQKERQLLESKRAEEREKKLAVAVALAKAEEKRAEDIKVAYQELEVTYKELSDTQAKLVQAGKMAALGELGTGIAHELNQPLTGILQFCSYHLKSLDQESELAKSFKIIREQGWRMADIIKKIYTFARPRVNAMSLVNIIAVLNDCLDLMNTQLKNHNIEIQVDFPSDFPIISSNHNSLQQIFINLLANARDAIDSLPEKPGGKILITGTIEEIKPGEKVTQIVFRDTGIDVDEQEEDRIFDPFFSTKDVGKGTGLGLSISYGIAQELLGSIFFRRGPNREKEFVLQIPLVEEL